MMVRVSSFSNKVCREGSPGSSQSDVWYSSFSNRFAGLLAAPRPFSFSLLTVAIIIRSMTPSAIPEYLVDLGRDFHHRGWVLGTSGSFSAVIERQPLRLPIPESSADKGRLRPEQIL